MRWNSLKSAVLAAPVWLGLVLFFASAAAGADSGIITVHRQTISRTLSAYAEVLPVALAPLRAGERGRVTGLSLEPGQAVDANEAVGHLTGPEIDHRRVQDHAAVDAARAKLNSARRTLNAQRRKRASQLSTLEDVSRARTEVAQARATLQTAQATLNEDQQNAVLRAPAKGTVISVDAGKGELVEAGRTLLTMQPAGDLWLKATYYGADADTLHPGIQGRFVPVDGHAPVFVKVAGLIPSTGPDGGRAVRLRATAPNPGWTAGESGMVELETGSYAAVPVPTRALVLDRGQWWVLLHTPHGDTRRAVVIGKPQGADTVIRKGLEEGDRIIVDQAYARFHRDFSRHYQQPD